MAAGVLLATATAIAAAAACQCAAHIARLTFAWLMNSPDLVRLPPVAAANPLAGSSSSSDGGSSRSRSNAAHQSQSSSLYSQSSVASSGTSIDRHCSAAAGDWGIEECWLHFNYADVYGDQLFLADDNHSDCDDPASAGGGHLGRRSALEQRKYTLHELTEMLQREPMPDEIVEYVDISLLDGGRGIRVTDGAKSSEMIGAQLIHEAGLVFSCSSLSPLTPGTCFNVTGCTTANCERFSVNLTVGGGGGGGGGSMAASKDIALHINPRLPQNYIVRNCRANGQWGAEEVTSPLPFRLRRAAPFAMQVLVTESDYFISVDGRHFAAFRHRLPYARVTSLQVYGDVLQVQVDQLSILQYPDQLCAGGAEALVQPVPTATTAGTAAAAAAAAANGADANGNVQLLEMPFYGRLAAPLRIGQSLHLFGTVKLLPHSFYVNLQRGHHIWPHPIIAFHLNPRFAGVGAQNVICRNSWHNGKWDREQRSEIYTDFMPSRTFHMEIRCEVDKYLVYVNGKCITEYAHRVEVCTVDTVHVQGDIRLQRVVLVDPLAQRAEAAR